MLYGEAELLAARPGDTVTGTAQWQSAAHFDSDDVTHFNARGVYALLYGREDVRLSAGDGDALRWLPQRAGKAFREKVAAIWDDPRVSGFLTAELTGDKSAMDDGDYLVRGVRPALRFSGDAAGTADLPAAETAVRRDHSAAAVLHGDGGHEPLGGPRLHHADIPADRAAVPAWQ